MIICGVGVISFRSVFKLGRKFRKIKVFYFFMKNCDNNI